MQRHSPAPSVDGSYWSQAQQAAWKTFSIHRCHWLALAKQRAAPCTIRAAFFNNSFINSNNDLLQHFSPLSLSDQECREGLTTNLACRSSLIQQRHRVTYTCFDYQGAMPAMLHYRHLSLPQATQGYDEVCDARVSKKNKKKRED